MNVTTLVGIFIVFAHLLIGIAALTLLLDVFFSRWIRRARLTAERMPFRAGIVGAINFVFFGVVTLVLFAIAQESNPDGARRIFQVLSALVLLVLATFLALGITASARWAGERIAPEATSVRQILTGIVTLELASLAPLVGWFLVLPIVILVGYGAVIISMVWRRDA